VSVSFTLCPVVRDTDTEGVSVFVPIDDTVTVFVSASVKDILLVSEAEEEALGVLL
jgi:hypothetical protein